MPYFRDLLAVGALLSAFAVAAYFIRTKRKRSFATGVVLCGWALDIFATGRLDQEGYGGPALAGPLAFLGGALILLAGCYYISAAINTPDEPPKNEPKA